MKILIYFLFFSTIILNNSCSFIRMQYLIYSSPKNAYLEDCTDTTKIKESLIKVFYIKQWFHGIENPEDMKSYYFGFIDINDSTVFVEMFREHEEDPPVPQEPLWLIVSKTKCQITDYGNSAFFKLKEKKK